LYNERYRKVPKKVSPAIRRREVESQMNIIRPFLKPRSCFLEIGAGDCALSLEVAKYVRNVFAVDVSNVVSAAVERERPPNFHLVISDGVNIDVEPGSIDVAYSNQVMEHVHPDDADPPLRSIRSTLVSRGRYICITPNALTGPHDISKFFDQVPTGFHLKEYSFAEVYAIFNRAGFSKIFAVIAHGRLHLRVPIGLLMILEAIVGRVPVKSRKGILQFIPLRFVLDQIQAVAVK
jgi:SAM-dependent methyltransferase